MSWASVVVPELFHFASNRQDSMLPCFRVILKEKVALLRILSYERTMGSLVFRCDILELDVNETFTIEVYDFKFVYLGVGAHRWRVNMVIIVAGGRRQFCHPVLPLSVIIESRHVFSHIATVILLIFTYDFRITRAEVFLDVDQRCCYVAHQTFVLINIINFAQSFLYSLREF